MCRPIGFCELMIWLSISSLSCGGGVEPAMQVITNTSNRDLVQPMSVQEIRKEVGALGPNDCLLKVPSIRRSFFEYMAGFAGFPQIESPTTHRFMGRWEESLQKARAAGTPLRGNVRVWEMAKRFPSYRDGRAARWRAKKTLDAFDRGN